MNAICEFGRRDDDVTQATDAAGRVLQSAFEQRLAEAKAEGQVDVQLDMADAARFLAAFLSGMKVSARGGATVEQLRAMAKLAVRGLR